jgi:hypothetical protein
VKSFKQRGIAALALSLTLCAVATACGGGDADQVPEVVCGTPVSPDLTRPLLPSTEDLTESSRVDRGAAISAPCTLLSSGRPVLELRFFWSMDAPNMAERSRYDSFFRDVSEWRPVKLGDEAIVGTNGSIVSAPCESGRNKHFTLEMHLPKAKITDYGLRKDIEKFMRAYFPATLETLNCG